LPLYELDDSALVFQPLPLSHQLMVSVPSYGVLVLIDMPIDTPYQAPIAIASTGSSATTADNAPVDPALAVPAVPPNLKVVVTVLPLPLPSLDPNASRLSSFLDYITPGFRMPRWHPRADRSDPKPSALRPSFVVPGGAANGVISFVAPGTSTMLTVFVPPRTPSSTTSAISSLWAASGVAMPGGVTLKAIQTSIPSKLAFERVIAVNNNQWLFEMKDHTRYMATAPVPSVATPWFLHPLTSSSTSVLPVDGTSLAWTVTKEDSKNGDEGKSQATPSSASTYAAPVPATPSTISPTNGASPAKIARRSRASDQFGAAPASSMSSSLMSVVSASASPSSDAPSRAAPSLTPIMDSILVPYRSSGTGVSSMLHPSEPLFRYSSPQKSPAATTSSLPSSIVLFNVPVPLPSDPLQSSNYGSMLVSLPKSNQFVLPSQWILRGMHFTFACCRALVSYVIAINQIELPDAKSKRKEMVSQNHM
jgi:hypothetical protein